MNQVINMLKKYFMMPIPFIQAILVYAFLIIATIFQVPKFIYILAGMFFLFGSDWKILRNPAIPHWLNLLIGVILYLWIYVYRFW